jgi:hypothetical protein
MSALRKTIRRDHELSRSISTGALPSISSRESFRGSLTRSSSSIVLSPLVLGGGSVGDCETTLDCEDPEELQGMFKQWKDQELHKQLCVLEKLQGSLCSILSRGSTEEDVRLHTYIVKPYEASFMMRCGWIQEMGLFFPDGLSEEYVDGEQELILESEKKKETGFVYSKGGDGVWREWRYHGLVEQNEKKLLDELHPLLIRRIGKKEIRVSQSDDGVIAPTPSTLMDEGDDFARCSSAPIPELDPIDERIASVSRIPREQGGLGIEMMNDCFQSMGFTSCNTEDQEMENPRKENTQKFRYLNTEDLVGQNRIPGRFYDALFNRKVIVKKNYHDLRTRSQDVYEALLRDPSFRVVNLERKVLHVSKSEVEFRKAESCKDACSVASCFFGLSMPEDSFFSTVQGMDVETAFIELVGEERKEFKIEKWRLGCAGVKNGVSGISSREKMHSKLHSYLQNPARHSDILVVEGYSHIRNGKSVLLFRFIYGPKDFDGVRVSVPGKCCQEAESGSDVYSYGPVSKEFMDRLPCMCVLKCVGFRRDHKVERTCVLFKGERIKRGKELYGHIMEQQKNGLISAPVLVEDEKVRASVLSSRGDYMFLGSCRNKSVATSWFVGVFHANSEDAEEWVSTSEFLFAIDVGLPNAIRGLDGWIGEKFARRISDIIQKDDSRFSCLRWTRPLVYRKGLKLTSVKCNTEGVNGILCICRRGGEKKKWDVSLLELIVDSRSNPMFASWNVKPGGLQMNRTAEYIDVLSDILVIPYVKIGRAEGSGCNKEESVLYWGSNPLFVEKRTNSVCIRDFVSDSSFVRPIKKTITPGEFAELATSP